MTEMMNKGQTCRHYWPPASELCINVDIVNQNIRYRSDMILCSALIGVPGSCSFDPLIILITASSDVIRLLELKDRECSPGHCAVPAPCCAGVRRVSGDGAAPAARTAVGGAAGVGVAAGGQRAEGSTG